MHLKPLSIFEINITNGFCGDVNNANSSVSIGDANIN